MSEVLPLVLDTHVWIWSANDHPRAQVVEWPSGALWLPAIAIWEVGMLVAKRRLTVEPDVHAWVRFSLRHPLLKILPLEPEIALLANNLPGVCHPDPADRIIIASAMHTGARLATADRKILHYCEIQGIPVLSFAQR